MWKVDDIHDFCKAFGKIDDEKDDEGKPKLNENGSSVKKIYTEIQAVHPFDHYAKVVYQRSSEARQAIQAINGKEIDGKKLNASEIIPLYDQKKEEQNTFLRRGIYVTNVPEDLIDPEELV